MDCGGRCASERGHLARRYRRYRCDFPPNRSDDWVADRNPGAALKIGFNRLKRYLTHPLGVLKSLLGRRTDGNTVAVTVNDREMLMINSAFGRRRRL